MSPSLSLSLIMPYSYFQLVVATDTEMVQMIESLSSHSLSLFLTIITICNVVYGDH